MELIPAIDLLEGKVVRLHQGRYDSVTTYGNDPLRVAQSFQQQGAKSLHVVDLEGARSGTPVHVDWIERIVKNTSLLVQVGGGIRTLEIAQRWLNLGAHRVVLGTAAVEHPEVVQQLCADRPGSVVVAIDAKNGKVAVEGWLKDSGCDAITLAREVDSWGVGAMLYTNIAKDGTKTGPDVAGTCAMQQGVKAMVIASGGIGSLDDLRALQKADIRAAVCGRALYAGVFTLKQANEALSRAST